MKVLLTGGTGCISGGIMSFDVVADFLSYGVDQLERALVLGRPQDD